MYPESLECDLRVELNEEIYRKYSKYERINGTILLWNEKIHDKNLKNKTERK